MQIVFLLFKHFCYLIESTEPARKNNYDIGSAKQRRSSFRPIFGDYHFIGIRSHVGFQ